MKNCLGETLAALILVLAVIGSLTLAIHYIGGVSIEVSLDKLAETAGWISAAVVLVILPLGFIVARLIEKLAPNYSHSVEDENTYYAP